MTARAEAGEFVTHWLIGCMVLVLLATAVLAWCERRRQRARSRAHHPAGRSQASPLSSRVPNLIGPPSHSRPCVCGRPWSRHTIHRDNGPCYLIGRPR